MLTADDVVLMTHSVSRPYAIKKGEEVDVLMPRQFASMYLDWHGEWHLPPLNGIASTPLLNDDGTISCTEGYDVCFEHVVREHTRHHWASIPERPTDEEAAAALLLIRDTFKTFCFADADTINDAASGVAVVDLNKPPGRDESAFLVALLTAVCRPSLHLAPGVMFTGTTHLGRWGR